jgi:hypothetical protein
MSAYAAVTGEDQDDFFFSSASGRTSAVSKAEVPVSTHARDQAVMGPVNADLPTDMPSFKITYPARITVSAADLQAAYGSDLKIPLTRENGFIKEPEYHNNAEDATPAMLKQADTQVPVRIVAKNLKTNIPGTELLLELVNIAANGQEKFPGNEKSISTDMPHGNVVKPLTGVNTVLVNRTLSKRVTDFGQKFAGMNRAVLSKLYWASNKNPNDVYIDVGTISPFVEDYNALEETINTGQMITQQKINAAAEGDGSIYLRGQFAKIDQLAKNAADVIATHLPYSPVADKNRFAMNLSVAPRSVFDRTLKKAVDIPQGFGTLYKSKFGELDLQAKKDLKEHYETSMNKPITIQFDLECEYLKFPRAFEVNM